MPLHSRYKQEQDGTSRAIAIIIDKLTLKTFNFITLYPEYFIVLLVFQLLWFSGFVFLQNKDLLVD